MREGLGSFKFDDSKFKKSQENDVVSQRSLNERPPDESVVLHVPELTLPVLSD